MEVSHIELAKLQRLAVDIAKVKRNHTFPNSDDNENVVEHCFSVALFCWKLYESLKPNLNLEKIFKYSLAHDFLERGLTNDVNTYASKQEYEAKVLASLTEEFEDFSNMTDIIHDYENLVDDEARFVKVADKMQAIILGELDDWRPYSKIGVTHTQFSEKGEEFLKFCPDCLKETLVALNTHSRAVFYDQPNQS
jgi:5'-deoxynucleotidase YfbR-like HD superfamily hydrolase